MTLDFVSSYKKNEIEQCDEMRRYSGEVKWPLELSFYIDPCENNERSSHFSDLSSHCQKDQN